MAAISAVRCARCQKLGHTNKECDLPFFRKQEAPRTAAQLLAEKAEKKAQWETRQAEREQKKAEWEAKQSAWQARQLEREAERAARQAAYVARQVEQAERRAAAQMPPWRKAGASSNAEDDGSSVAGASDTTGLASAIDDAEVERMAMLDKEVRKFQKTLREIAKLEDQEHLDKLQQEKVAKKRELEQKLSTAIAVAQALARSELKRQTPVGW
eukprot:TRINITY_DN993_c0_g2_i1.p2 TRINITY_DN993_c0_g2~~TRINITY_DN993_c0_g2_i1.p2  ORF type:complete len:213 (+),score=75.02 TRINITY_DN993_c0_g2_i1:62-700(+)